ncbi:hypothetical protein Taro_033541 [Colocasia esculenta]|uniref:Aminotransferase-like plant mobile domain-containing protein n=1 Tax=Colocasia esculenta TaxID=4460 RepID=A0A843VU36_COLES|nr:hypothetical protein [Colocasia esculenta]
MAAAIAGIASAYVDTSKVTSPSAVTFSECGRIWEDIPPYSGPKAARDSYADLKQLSAIPGHIYTRPELQILPSQRRFSKVPWLVPMLELLPPTPIGHLREWGLSTVFLLAKNYNKMVHVWESVTAMTELWHPQTNTFVFPGFEATILLEELEVMLGLPCYQRGEELTISYTWITSQCKRKTKNYAAITKAAAICICGIILFPKSDGAISFGNLSIIFSISEAQVNGTRAWREYLRNLTVAEFDMRPRFMHGRIIHVPQRTGLALRLLGNEALVSYNPDHFYLQCGAARTVVPILSHFPPIQERKRGDAQDERDMRSAIVHWEGCTMSVVQAEVEDDNDVIKEYIEALKEIQPVARTN